MKLKRLEEYTDRQLLELIVSNQVRLEQRLHKMYWYLANKDTENFSKHDESKSDAFKEFVESFVSLNQEIEQVIKEEQG